MLTGSLYVFAVFPIKQFEMFPYVLFDPVVVVLFVDAPQREQTVPEDRSVLVFFTEYLSVGDVEHLAHIRVGKQSGQVLVNGMGNLEKLKQLQIENGGTL